MRIRRPQPGPTDQKKPAPMPAGGVARPDFRYGHAATAVAPSQLPKNHPALTSIARLLGQQVARAASAQGGVDD